MRGVVMLALLAAGLVSCGGEDAVGLAELDAALERARREGKLVLLDFYGDHCPPCARMKKETWPAPEVREQLERFVFLEIDTSRSAELVRRFGVRVIPTICVLVGGGDGRRARGPKDGVRYPSGHLTPSAEVATWRCSPALPRAP